MDARDATTNIYLYRMVRCCRPIILLLFFVVLLRIVCISANLIAGVILRMLIAFITVTWLSRE